MERWILGQSTGSSVCLNIIENICFVACERHNHSDPHCLCVWRDRGMSNFSPLIISIWCVQVNARAIIITSSTIHNYNLQRRHDCATCTFAWHWYPEKGYSEFSLFHNTFLLCSNYHWPSIILIDMAVHLGFKVLLLLFCSTVLLCGVNWMDDHDIP